MDRNISSSRLKSIRREYRNGEMSQEAFASYLGIPLPTYKSLEGGKSPLTVDKINVLKERADVNPVWLLYGEGNMFLSDNVVKQDVLIPYYEDIRASAGFGALNGDVREPEYIHLPPALVRRGCRSRTEAFRCSGDSMIPFLKDGDIMFVDKSQIEIKDGDVYVVRFGEDLFVKRLFKVPGKLIARSDNSLYPEFDLTSDSFEVLGKVIYKMEEA